MALDNTEKVQDLKLVSQKSQFKVKHTDLDYKTKIEKKSKMIKSFLKENGVDLPQDFDIEGNFGHQRAVEELLDKLIYQNQTIEMPSNIEGFFELISQMNILEASQDNSAIKRKEGVIDCKQDLKSQRNKASKNKQKNEFCTEKEALRELLRETFEEVEENHVDKSNLGHNFFLKLRLEEDNKKNSEKNENGENEKIKVKVIRGGTYRLEAKKFVEGGLYKDSPHISDASKLLNSLSKGVVDNKTVKYSFLG